MHISGSLVSRNVAFILGYSTISLQRGIQAVLQDTVFTNNSAINGGIMIAKDQCIITLTNCTFSSNKAITRKLLTIPKNLKSVIVTQSHHQNNTETFTARSPFLFNYTTSRHRNLQRALNHIKKQTKDKQSIGVLPVDLLVRISSSNKKSAQLKGVSRGLGGAIFVTIQSEILVTNCVFEDNSAQVGAGAIVAGFNVILDIQETTFIHNKALFYDGGAIYAQGNVILSVQETTFVGNKASRDGGVIDLEQHSHLRIKNCVFDENTSMRIGGAISGAVGVTLDIQETNFTRNSATVQSGAIDVDQQAHIRIKNCVFEDNISQRIGGAITGTDNATVDVQETSFTRNRAVQAGGIDVQYQSHLRITNCVFEDNVFQGSGGAITGGFNASIGVQEANFIRNNASQGGAITVSQQAQLRITNCLFDDNLSDLIGGAITGEGNVTVDIKKTNFTRNRSVQEGIIVVQYQSHLRITNCVFEDNVSQVSGGALLLVASM